MAWDDWLKGRRKVERQRVHSSEDFRSPSSAAARPEPRLPPFTDAIGVPYLGAVKAYYFILAALFLTYLLSHVVLVGLAAGALMVGIVLWEFYCGMRTGGVRRELEETAIAIGLALLIWFGAGFALNTPTPINAIVSCSMLPAYERGDMVMLQGGLPRTQYFDYAGRAEDINASAWIRMDASGAAGRSGGERVEPFAVRGSLLGYCLQEGAADPRCQRFIADPGAFVETHGPLEMRYGYCRRDYPKTGEEKTAICVTHTAFDGKPVPFDAGAELVVYSPKPAEYYGRSVGGEIVHRARLAVRASDGLAILTKGDNNPVYDLQAYDPASEAVNEAVSPEQLKGRVIVRLPFLGNLKLFITPGALLSPAALSGCDSRFHELQ